MRNIPLDDYTGYPGSVFVIEFGKLWGGEHFMMTDPVTNPEANVFLKLKPISYWYDDDEGKPRSRVPNAVCLNCGEPEEFDDKTPVYVLQVAPKMCAGPAIPMDLRNYYPDANSSG